MRFKSSKVLSAVAISATSLFPLVERFHYTPIWPLLQLSASPWRTRSPLWLLLKQGSGQVRSPPTRRYQRGGGHPTMDAQVRLLWGILGTILLLETCH